MKISEIKIRKLLSEGRLRAVVSVTFDEVFAVHDIKIVEGDNRMFVAMPSRRDENGRYRDIVHPITSEFRLQTENAILEYYNEYILDYQQQSEKSE